MARCLLHVEGFRTSDCTCANTPYSYAIERVRIAYHATHWPGSYGDHLDCCDDFDKLLDRIRRQENNPAFVEGNKYD